MTVRTRQTFKIRNVISERIKKIFEKYIFKCNSESE
jgi:hypothetical protein